MGQIWWIIFNRKVRNSLGAEWPDILIYKPSIWILHHMGKCSSCFQYSPSSLFPLPTAMAYPTHALHLFQNLLPHTWLLHSSLLLSAHPSQLSTEHFPRWSSYHHPHTMCPPNIYYLPFPFPERLRSARGLHICTRTQTDLSSYVWRASCPARCTIPLHICTPSLLLLLCHRIQDWKWIVNFGLN